MGANSITDWLLRAKHADEPQHDSTLSLGQAASSPSTLDAGPPQIDFESLKYNLFGSIESALRQAEDFGGLEEPQAPVQAHATQGRKTARVRSLEMEAEGSDESYRPDNDGEEDEEENDDEDPFSDDDDEYKGTNDQAMQGMECTRWRSDLACSSPPEQA